MTASRRQKQKGGFTKKRFFPKAGMEVESSRLIAHTYTIILDLLAMLWLE
jgi:hypothetical protein